MTTFVFKIPGTTFQVGLDTENVKHKKPLPLQLTNQHGELINGSVIIYDKNGVLVLKQAGKDTFKFPGGKAELTDAGVPKKAQDAFLAALADAIEKAFAVHGLSLDSLKDLNAASDKAAKSFGQEQAATIVEALTPQVAELAEAHEISVPASEATIDEEKSLFSDETSTRYGRAAETSAEKASRKRAINREFGEEAGLVVPANAHLVTLDRATCASIVARDYPSLGNVKAKELNPTVRTEFTAVEVEDLKQFTAEAKSPEGYDIQTLSFDAFLNGVVSSDPEQGFYKTAHFRPGYDGTALLAVIAVTRPDLVEAYNARITAQAQQKARDKLSAGTLAGTSVLAPKPGVGTSATGASQEQQVASNASFSLS